MQLAALYGDGPLHPLTGNTVPDMAALRQQLDAIRAGGFAYDREEHALGKCAIGLPVGTHRGVLLAISVVMPSQRFERQRAIAWKRPCAPASSVAARVWANPAELTTIVKTSFLKYDLRSRSAGGGCNLFGRISP
jgi:DNA-binding IclR family transcriptional regulator